MKDNEQRFEADFEVVGNEPLTEKQKALLRKAVTNIGTKSSGNYGHEGRPGERGGSAPGGISEDEKRAIAKDPQASRNMAVKTKQRIPEAAKRFGYTAADENVHLQRYMDDDYQEVNSILREGIEPYAAPKDILYSLEGLCDESPSIGEGIVMYRGLGEHSGMAMADKEVGTILEDKAFQSFSLDPHEVEYFTMPWGEDRAEKPEYTIIRAVTGKGTKALVTGSKEEEIIVQHGTKWAVASKDVFDMENRLGKKAKYHVITVVPS